MSAGCGYLPGGVIVTPPLTSVGSESLSGLMLIRLPQFSIDRDPWVRSTHRSPLDPGDYKRHPPLPRLVAATRFPVVPRTSPSSGGPSSACGLTGMKRPRGRLRGRVSGPKSEFPWGPQPWGWEAKVPAVTSFNYKKDSPTSVVCRLDTCTLAEREPRTALAEGVCCLACACGPPSRQSAFCQAVCSWVTGVWKDQRTAWTLRYCFALKYIVMDPMPWATHSVSWQCWCCQGLWAQREGVDGPGPSIPATLKWKGSQEPTCHQALLRPLPGLGFS